MQRIKKFLALAVYRGRIQNTGSWFFTAIKSGNPTTLDNALRMLLSQEGIANKAWQITSTLKLSDPPQEVVDRARTLRDVKKNLIGG